MRLNIFDRLSFLALFFVIVLLAFFFLPFTNIPIETSIEISKGLLLVVGLTFSVIFWGFARFSDGKISLPKSYILLSGGGIVLAFFFSALFTKTPQVSFFGAMFDVGTFWFIFCGFLLMLMSSILFQNPRSAKIVLFGAVLSSAVVLIFQSARLFMPEVLSLGVLIEKTNNVLGSWNALGFFAGFSALMSLLVIEFFSTTKIEKWILEVLIVLSMILITVVNFSFVWILLGISSLMIFIYKILITSHKNLNESVVNEEGQTHFPVFSFVITIIALLFFMSGQSIREALPNRLGLLSSEISPSFSATMLVTKSVLKENPLFGVGPNKFGEAWAMYKPVAINTTAFWDVSFNSGSGLIPTFASTTGYLGIFTWLTFFILFVIGGIKSIFSNIKNDANWEMVAFFILSFYLFVSSFFYSTGPVLFLLALAFTGVFIGLSASSSSNGEILLIFLSNHKKSFPFIFFLVFIIIISAVASFKYIERLTSVSYFGKALAAPTVPVAEASINKALTLYSSDLYLRTYAQIYLVKLNSLIAKEASLSEVEKADLQTSLDQAINGAQSAILYNPKNYLNFQALGSLYQNLALLGVKDTYSKAIEAYKVALTLNPLNPGLKLAMAKASFTAEKNKEAKDYANTALSLKPDYIDALVVLSQIAKSEGDNAGALSYAQTALSFSPENQSLITYIDSLKTASLNDNAVSSDVAVPSDIIVPPKAIDDKTKNNSTKKGAN